MLNNILQKLFKKNGYKIVPYRTSNAIISEKLYKAFGIYPDPIKHDFCFTRATHLLDLNEKRNAILTISNEGKMILSFDDICFEINAPDEIFIIHEVFVNGVYNYNSNEDFILIDVGMNIGAASLFFSKNKYCKKIIAFEPFYKTVEAAKHNLILNPQLAGKIEIQQTGLGYPSRNLQVAYTTKHKGTVGLNGVAGNNGSPEEKAELRISDVYDELKKVFETKYIQKIIKIDCEGAEYEIIERLQQMNCIAAFDVYMIEWHTKGPQQINEILISNGFHVHSTNDFGKGAGMIYAYKK